MTHTITRGVRYLDLDDDGVPDAVLITETWPEGADGGHKAGTVVETLETGIGIDGCPPRRLRTRTPLTTRRDVLNRNTRYSCSKSRSALQR